MTDFFNDKIAFIAPLMKSIAPFLLIAACCAGVVKGAYLILEHYLLQPPERPYVIEETVEQDNGTDEPLLAGEKDYTIILERNLFGLLPENTIEDSREASDYTDDLELTNLDIVLLGTVQGSKAGNRAIILDRGTNKQELYEKGDMVHSASIEKILRGKVILSFNGRDQMLDMSAAAEMRKSGTVTAPSGQTRPRIAVPEKNPVAVAPARSAKRTRTGRPERIVRPRVIRPSRQIRTE